MPVYIFVVAIAKIRTSSSKANLMHSTITHTHTALRGGGAGAQRISSQNFKMERTCYSNTSLRACVCLVFLFKLRKCILAMHVDGVLCTCLARLKYSLLPHAVTLCVLCWCCLAKYLLQTYIKRTDNNINIRLMCANEVFRNFQWPVVAVRPAFN